MTQWISFHQQVFKIDKRLEQRDYNKYQPIKILLTKNMQSLKQDSIKTQIQQFILDIANIQTETDKAAITFLGIVPDSQSSGSFDTIEQKNEYFLEKLTLAIIGKSTESNIDSYQKLTIQNVSIYKKQFHHQNQLMRIVYIPADDYDLSSPQSAQLSYLRMVKKFFLSNLYMKPQLTDKIKPVALQFLPKPNAGPKGKLSTINISERFGGFYEEIKKCYNLTFKQQIQKISFILVIEEQKEPLNFGFGDKPIEINRQILIMTKDQADFPIYKIEKVGDTIKLGNKQVVLKDTSLLVEVKNYHLLFHYNKFTTCQKFKIANTLDKLIAEQFWGVVQTIIHPLLIIKKRISQFYDLQQKETFTKDSFEKIDEIRWNSNKMIKNDFIIFNQMFGLEEWKENQKQLIVINDEDDILDQNECHERTNNMTEKKAQGDNIESFESKLYLYSRFTQQQPNFIHAMVLDHLNLLYSQVFESSELIQKATNDEKKKHAQRRVLEHTKTIARFLTGLKQYSFCSQFLEQYNGEFFQYLLDKYIGAYIQFCYGNNQIYGKLFDLSQKISDIRSTKQQIMQVIKSVNSFTQIYKKQQNDITYQHLENNKLLLEILLKLLEQNKSDEKNKQIQTKILSTKYDLGSTYYKIALIQNFGHTQSSQLKAALKILFHDLYFKLFVQRKDFEKEYAQHVVFNQLQLLEKVSGLLKLLDSIDLAIEIQKKLDNINTVENYFNRWLMKYHRLNNRDDQKIIISICEKAIQYFTIKYETQKVVRFYNLLIQNSLDFKEKQTWKTKKFKYIKSSQDPDWIKKSIEKAQKTIFPISSDASKKIITLIQQLLENKQQ